MGTGVLRLLGGEVENRCVRSGPDSYSVIGEANTQPPAVADPGGGPGGPVPPPWLGKKFFLYS